MGACACGAYAYLEVVYVSMSKSTVGSLFSTFDSANLGDIIIGREL